jgi:hypothetical protein
VTISSEVHAGPGAYAATGSVVSRPWSEKIVPVVLNPKTFVSLLVLATVIPFFAGGLTLFKIIGVAWILAFIAFLAQVHVPMTVYLLSDRDIGVQMVRRWATLTGGCTLLIAASMFIFTAFSAKLGSQHSEILYAFAFAGVVWQHWHFGKQNLGVLALARIATKTGSVARFERYTIVAGAICGMVAAYLIVGKAFQQLYSPNSDLSSFQSTMEVVSAQFRWIQYALAAVAVAYTIYNFRRFTPATAVLYLLGVCFFLPQFLAVDMPQYLLAFTSNVFAHGAQYMVILFYHALGSIDLIHRADGSKPVSTPILTSADYALVARRMMRFLRLISPLLFFALALAFAMSKGNYFEVIWRVTNRGMHMHLGAPTVDALAGGLVWGTLLCHFWLDSFFWRLKEKVPREWIKSRYAFLFGGSGRSGH